MKEMMSNIPATPKIESLPKELAERYVARTWIDGTEMVHDGDKSRIYRIFECQATIPGVGVGKLRVDARHWHHPDETLHRDQIRFEYVLPGEKGDRLVAEMHLNELEEDAFWLQHRYVQPEYRGRKGIGSALLQQAEDWLRQVGEVHGHDVRLGLSAGQIDVFRWLQKQKFLIRKREKPMLDEILRHPEHFDIESATDDPNITQDLYVFHKETPGRSREESVRLRFEKRIFTGLPSPKTDNIMRHFVPSWDEPIEPSPEKESIAVRVATARDASNISKIYGKSVIATYTNEKGKIFKADMAEYIGDPSIDVLRWYDDLVETDPNIHTTVLTEGGRVVGFCRARKEANVGHIEKLYLDPASSEKGLGGELLREGIAWLGNEHPVELEVVAYNDRAIRFYERNGFRVQGQAAPLVLPSKKEIPMVSMVKDRQEE
jgi:ribosomal protein S18 acetylase RimI-like enzyme